MQKVGIVTLVGYFNYGNRLQNYALKRSIEKIGYEVESLTFEDTEGFLTFESDDNYNVYKRIKDKSVDELFKTVLKRTVNKFKRYKFRKELQETEEIRTKKFKEFTDNLLNEVEFSKTEVSKYDYFVVGSDQVWNPNYIKNQPQFFLPFGEKNQKISYAASFGISELDEKVELIYKDYLNEFSNISVRENEGANLVREMIGVDVPVVLDPTLLLNAEEWEEISSRAYNRPSEDYLLTYFLGGPTPETRKKLEKLAKEKNMTIINLGDITERETYETGPSEFLDYINNASAFFTDSFHGVVFSIIFQTPFVVYERQSFGPSMYSRIETILDNFNMRNREANGFNEDIFSMDFSGTYEVLEREYNKSIDYLKEALRIEE